MSQQQAEGDGITITNSMLQTMAEQGYALVLVRADAVRFVYPPGREAPHD